MSSCKNDKLSPSREPTTTTAAAHPQVAGCGTETESKPATLERRQIFQPALSIQRYQWVQSFLEERHDIRSITDVGCGNGRMLLWLKSIKHLESIKLIDKDNTELEPDYNSYLQPGLWDMIFGRKECAKPLRVEVYHGDLTEPNEALQSDCFTLIEVVEHLEPPMVERCISVVFNYYRPRLVIVSTPNSEFNHLLRALPHESATSFRHADHKFEWTRAQFRSWCESVTKRVNNGYSYQLHGVGHLSHSEAFGPCTQIATFTRLTEEEANREEQKRAVCLEMAVGRTHDKHNPRATELVLDYEIPAAKQPAPQQESPQQEKTEQVNYESW